MKKYITMKQIFAAIFACFMLYGNPAYALVKGAISHPDSAIRIQDCLTCELDYAQRVCNLMVTIDETIYAFLDYNGNKCSPVWHVEKFDRCIHDLSDIIKQGQKNPAHAKAVDALTEIHKTLVAIRGHVHSAKKGEAKSLGFKLAPLIKVFDNKLPISLSAGLETKLKRAYGYSNVNPLVYLAHLRHRLDYI